MNPDLRLNQRFKRFYTILPVMLLSPEESRYRTNLLFPKKVHAAERNFSFEKQEKNLIRYSSNMSYRCSYHISDIKKQDKSNHNETSSHRGNRHNAGGRKEQGCKGKSQAEERKCA
jgi:hypothetical protein